MDSRSSTSGSTTSATTGGRTARFAVGPPIRDPVADLVQHAELADREMDAATGRTRPATHRLVSVTATARMPTVPK